MKSSEGLVSSADCARELSFSNRPIEAGSSASGGHAQCPAVGCTLALSWDFDVAGNSTMDQWLKKLHARQKLHQHVVLMFPRMSKEWFS